MEYRAEFAITLPEKLLDTLGIDEDTLFEAYFDDGIKAEDFLMQDAYHIQPDLFDRNTYQLITNEAKELQEHQSEDEDQSFQDTQQMM